MTIAGRVNRDKSKRSLLLVGVFTFIFHSIVPYFQGATAESSDGYTTTICTTYGYKTVFVAFDSPQEIDDNQLDSSYFECPTCIVQANATGWIDTYSSLFDPHTSQDREKWVAQLPLTPESPAYPHFLSRAPPA